MTDTNETDRPKPRTYGPSYLSRAEDPARCVAAVRDGNGWGDRQCSRPRGHGPGGCYCKQHDPAAVEARRDAAHENWKFKRRAEHRPIRQRNAFQAALEQIVKTSTDSVAVEIAREALKTE